MTAISSSIAWRFRPSDRKDVDRLYEIWLASVIATHDFVDRADLAEICVFVRETYLPHAHLTVAVNDKHRPIGFMGMSGEQIDSLFLDPAYRGKGLGRTFVDLAKERSTCLSVTVNAQNEQAVGFYKAVGFSVISSSPTDDEGRPYPILRMRQVGREDSSWLAGESPFEASLL